MSHSANKALLPLLAVATLAFLPLFPGFAGLWALLQALVAGWRLGGAALPLFCAGALVLAGAAAAFEFGGMCNYQIQLSRGRAVVPVTRDYIGHAEAVLRGG